jgi:DNA-binding response OmpR family regulator/HD-GYP domain-containing protein (c-di-GMP phosphodiesterase class II)
MAEASILIVDDEPEVCELLAEWLGQDGEWAVDYTTEPRRALEQVAQGGYDLLITDLLMPELDGLTLAREARGLCPRLGVIAITGHGSIDSSVEALRLGLKDYLCKPFRIEEVRAAVFRALSEAAGSDPGEAAADEVTHDNAVLAAQNDDLGQRLDIVSRDLTLMQQRLAGHVADLETRCDVADLLDGQRDVDQLLGLALMLVRKRLPGEEHTLALLGRRPARALAVAGIEGEDIVVHWQEEPLGRGVLRAVMKRQQPALIEDLAISQVLGNLADWTQRQGSLVILPLVGGGRVQAVVNVRRSETGTAFGACEVQRAMPLCSELGRAIEAALAMKRQRSHTYNCLKAMAERLDESLGVAGHSRRVAGYACAIGRRLGLGEARVNVLRLAGQLHDIGKLGLSAPSVSDSRKPDQTRQGPALSHEERGWQLLLPLRFLGEAAELVRYHHAAGGSAQSASVQCQALIVAEAFDELTRDGPNSPGLTQAEAITHLRARGQFSGEVLRALERQAAIDA